MQTTFTLHLYNIFKNILLVKEPSHLSDKLLRIISMPTTCDTPAVPHAHHLPHI
ncbi:hypothetical protein EV682_101460 [Iodobacter fluviatilis]|uniref:Uncharacterized protein n=1 Tax=Iodobacter fluviatilis TaxID=537 RepID=A0A377Q2P2_9NEIS|nr:hypothetical protein EV682_101460 [Iodobacter fluviatilis]STQ89454.1 Uncharacterised protein [Iodobacter fluviatilis]